jgi:hypothetical protein
VKLFQPSLNHIHAQQRKSRGSPRQWQHHVHTSFGQYSGQILTDVCNGTLHPTGWRASVLWARQHASLWVQLPA